MRAPALNQAMQIEETNYPNPNDNQQYYSRLNDKNEIEPNKKTTKVTIHDANIVTSHEWKRIRIDKKYE